MPKKQKLNLIEELTTYKDDYQVWHVKPSEPTNSLRPRKEPLTKPPPRSIHVDLQTLAAYNPSVCVPLDLYYTPKPIIGKDPRECFSTNQFSKLNRGHKKTPLSTLLPPAVCLDQIEDEESLNTILRYTYVGMHKVLFEEAAIKISKKPNQQTFNRVEAEGTDLRFKPITQQPIPPGWITAAQHWDSMHSRMLGDPFRYFWSIRGPEVECSCCCNPLPRMLPKETKEEIERLVCEDKLSLPYNITKVGYGGYRQICAKGASLEKK